MNFKNFKRLPFNPSIQRKHLIYGCGFGSYSASLSCIKDIRCTLDPKRDALFIADLNDAEDFLKKCRDNIF